MYTVTLELNQTCNLDCTYCYLSDKNYMSMTYDIGVQSIELSIQKAKQHRDKSLTVDFVGGEALLDFKLLKSLVGYLKKRSLEEDLQLSFMMTTNGMLIDEKSIDFISDNNFALKVSIDGKRPVHDFNRKTHNGNGSYNSIIEKLDWFKYYEEKTGRSVQVTNVVTGSNFMFLSQTIEHLIGDLGFKIVDTAFDIYYKWDANKMKIIEQEVEKVIEYYIKMHKAKKAFVWSFIDSTNKIVKQKEKVYACGAGIISMYVKNNGDYFPCPGCFKDEVCIGRYDYGHYIEKIEKLKSVTEIDNDKCKTCNIYDYCVMKSCLMLNLEINGNMNLPIEFNCWLSKLQYRLNLKYSSRKSS